MIHHCSNCGCELDGQVKFCPNCGAEQHKIQSRTPEKKAVSSSDEIPLQIILRKIANHKILSIVMATLVILSIGGYYCYKKYSAEKAAKELVEKGVKHLFEISGTYKATGMELQLSPDGTARITTNNRKWYVGYWTEKHSDYPIEISFSESFGIEIGSKYYDYCRFLYFIQNTLWYDLDAIKSRDFGKCTFLTKEKK
jgi:uncharacterized membrane protein YvbJ